MFVDFLEIQKKIMSISKRCYSHAKALLNCVWNYSGSPAIRGEEGEDTDADDVSDYNYPASGSADQKQKIADRMRSWRMNAGGGGDVGRPKYDSGEIGLTKYDSGEIPRGYIPSVTNSQVGASF